MFVLDLFNTDHERRLAEGAVDQLEQRRIDDLAMKMDDLVARAKQAKDPEHRAALVREFQKVKDERDSYFKIKDECMGYGSVVGEETHEFKGAHGKLDVERTPGKTVVKRKEYPGSDETRTDRFPNSRLRGKGTGSAVKAGSGFSSTHGSMRKMPRLDHDANDVPNYEVDEAGIPGNVPTEKIPGKEDLLKGRGRGYYESVEEANPSKKVFKDKTGKPVGEIGIDPESSPGNGEWYVYHYGTGYSVVGFDSAAEAKRELLYVHKHPEAVEGHESTFETEAGIPGSVPAEKIPGKEDLLKGRGRQTYEAQDQKKNSEVTDPAIDRLLVKAHRDRPKARTDAEALAMRILGQEQDDVERLDQVNDREDHMIARLDRLEQELQQQIDQIKNHKELDEGHMSELDAMRQDLERMNERQFYTAHGLSKAAFQQRYRTLLKPALDESQRLHVGDPVIVTAPNAYEGKTGEIAEFSPSGSFIIVDLYNYGEHSMHLSDVEYNQYADEEDELDEGAGVAYVTTYFDTKTGDQGESTVSALTKHDAADKIVELMHERGYDIVVTAVRPALGEGSQDFNKVEPYEVCLAGKPVKTFDYYEDARRFHDNWKKKLYAQGEKAKADRITLNPVMKEATNRHFGPKGAGTELARQIRTNGDTNWTNSLSKDQLDKLAGPRYPKRPKIQVKKNKDINEFAPTGNYKPPVIPREPGKEPFEDDPRSQTVSRVQQLLDAGKSVFVLLPGAKGRAIGTQMGDDHSWLNVQYKGWQDPKTRSRSRLTVNLRAEDDASLTLTPGSKFTDNRGRPFDYTLSGQADTSRGLGMFGMEEGVAESADDSELANADYGRKILSGLEKLCHAIKSRRPEVFHQLDDVYQSGGVGEWIVEALHLDMDEFLKFSDKFEEVGGDPIIDFFYAWQEGRWDQFTAPWQAYASKVLRSRGKGPSIHEAETDYSKRRQRERDVDAGKPVAKQRQPRMTDYQKRRAQQKKEMELGEESSTSSEAVERAVLNRIMVAHTDLLMKFGPEKVMQAVDEVAYGVGDVDEIGSSDVSAWIHEVKRILGAE